MISDPRERFALFVTSQRAQFHSCVFLFFVFFLQTSVAIAVELKGNFAQFGTFEMQS